MVCKVSDNEKRKKRVGVQKREKKRREKTDVDQGDKIEGEFSETKVGDVERVFGEALFEEDLGDIGISTEGVVEGSVAEFVATTKVSTLLDQRDNRCFPVSLAATVDEGCVVVDVGRVEAVCHRLDERHCQIVDSTARGHV